MKPHPDPSSACSAAGPIGCVSCDLHEICRLAGVLAFDASRSRQSTGTLRTVEAGAYLFRGGDPAHMVYAVRRGLLKTVRLCAEGDEQITALNTPGEVLGLEAFATGTYASDVIAVQPVVCCELPLQLIAEEAGRDGDIGAALVRLLSRSILPRSNPARGSIRQRVSNFLLDLGWRLTHRGLDGRQFALGLSRREIANLLDTRVETVSRVLQELHREQAIRVRGGKVSLLSLAPLGGTAARLDRRRSANP